MKLKEAFVYVFQSAVGSVCSTGVDVGAGAWVMGLERGSFKTEKYNTLAMEATTTLAISNHIFHRVGLFTGISCGGGGVAIGGWLVFSIAQVLHERC